MKMKYLQPLNNPATKLLQNQHIITIHFDLPVQPRINPMHFQMDYPI